MKKLLLFSLISLCASSSIAQDSLYSKVLHNNGGYKGFAIKVDDDSNVAQVGMTNFNNASFSLLDSLGNILNDSQYTIDGQPFSNFEFHDVAALSDGNYLVVGTVMLQNFGVNVGIAAKLSASGTVIWSKGIFPQAPIYFSCNAVIESSENSYWIAGSDDQSGEMVIAELDTDGTTLQVNSYKNNGLRYRVEDILEYNMDTLVFSGYTSDNSNVHQGLVFATDNAGTVLWNNVLPNHQFYDLGTDNSMIRIASFSAKVGIVSVQPGGAFTTLHQMDELANVPENMDMAKLKDSTYVITSTTGFDSNIDMIEIGNALAGRSSYMGMVTDVASRENKGAYINAYGPIYGIKSTSWFAIPHGNIVRTDSLLTLPNCSWGENPVLALTSALTDQTMSFTSITDASIMDLLILQSDNDLDDSVSCVDFYSGINENGIAEINLYPNPANSKITIELAAEASGIMTILDLHGKVVLSIVIDQNTAILDISSLNKGMYVYSFINKESQTVTNGKLIKN